MRAWRAANTEDGMVDWRGWRGHAVMLLALLLAAVAGRTEASPTPAPQPTPAPPPTPAPYSFVGAGWCLDTDGHDIGRHLPCLWKPSASESELRSICDQFEACVAIDWGNNENGHARFSSAAALHAITAPSGWGKWSEGCQHDCEATTAGEAHGECWKKDCTESWVLEDTLYGVPASGCCHYAPLSNFLCDASTAPTYALRTQAQSACNERSEASLIVRNRSPNLHWTLASADACRTACEGDEFCKLWSFKAAGYGVGGATSGSWVPAMCWLVAEKLDTVTCTNPTCVSSGAVTGAKDCNDLRDIVVSKYVGGIGGPTNGGYLESDKPFCVAPTEQPDAVGTFTDDGQLVMSGSCKHRVYDQANLQKCLDGVWYVIVGGSNSLLMGIQLANQLVPGTFHPTDTNSRTFDTHVHDAVFQTTDSSYTLNWKNSELAFTDTETWTEDTWNWETAIAESRFATILDKAPAFHSGSGLVTRVTGFVGQYWNNVDAVMKWIEDDVKWAAAKVTLITQISQWYPVCGIYNVGFCNRKQIMHQGPDATLTLYKSEMQTTLQKMATFCKGNGRAGQLGCSVQSNTYDPGQIGTIMPFVTWGVETIQPYLDVNLRWIDLWELGKAGPAETVAAHYSPAMIQWANQIVLNQVCEIHKTLSPLLQIEASTKPFVTFTGDTCFGAQTAAAFSFCTLYNQQCNGRCDGWECLHGPLCKLEPTETRRARTDDNFFCKAPKPKHCTDHNAIVEQFVLQTFFIPNVDCQAIHNDDTTTCDGRNEFSQFMADYCCGTCYSSPLSPPQLHTAEHPSLTVFDWPSDRMEGTLTASVDCSRVSRIFCASNEDDENGLRLHLAFLFWGLLAILFASSYLYALLSSRRQARNLSQDSRQEPAPPKTSPDYVPLGFARFLASLHIVAGHLFAEGKTPNVYLFGWGFTWVPWFFMLSGFVLFMAYDRNPRKEDPLTYIRRRSVTIYPLYAMSVLLAFVLVKSGNAPGVVPDIGYLIAQIWLVQSWVPWLPEQCFQMHCWFLSCMIVYWLLFPGIVDRVRQIKSIKQLIAWMLGICSLPWIALIIIPAAAQEKLNWYSEHTFKDTDSLVDLAVVFLKFNPICYFHVFFLGMLVGQLRSVLIENGTATGRTFVWTNDPASEEETNDPGDNRRRSSNDFARTVEASVLPISFGLLMLLFNVEQLKPWAFKLSARLSILLPLQAGILLGLAGFVDRHKKPFLSRIIFSRLEFLAEYSYVVYLLQFICIRQWPVDFAESKRNQYGWDFWCFLIGVSCLVVHLVRRPVEWLWKKFRFNYQALLLVPLLFTLLVGGMDLAFDDAASRSQAQFSVDSVYDSSGGPPVIIPTLYNHETGSSYKGQARDYKMMFQDYHSSGAKRAIINPSIAMASETEVFVAVRAHGRDSFQQVGEYQGNAATIIDQVWHSETLFGTFSLPQGFADSGAAPENMNSAISSSQITLHAWRANGLKTPSGEVWDDLCTKELQWIAGNNTLIRKKVTGPEDPKLLVSGTSSNSSQPWRLSIAFNSMPPTSFGQKSDGSCYPVSQMYIGGDMAIPNPYKHGSANADEDPGLSFDPASFSTTPTAGQRFSCGFKTLEEKNWIPFTDIGGSLHFVYSPEPHQIVVARRDGECEKTYKTSNSVLAKILEDHPTWRIRGNAQAIYIGPNGGDLISDSVKASPGTLSTNLRNVQYRTSEDEVGGYGGTCTCPNGEVLFAGDNMDDCASLACIGGIPGQCIRSVDERWARQKTVCLPETGAGSDMPHRVYGHQTYAHYLGVFHLIDLEHPGKYLHYLYRFDASPPFRVRQVALKQLPLLDLAPDVNAQPMSFVSGLTRVGNKVLISYGAGDRESRLLVMTAEEVDKYFDACDVSQMLDISTH